MLAAQAETPAPPVASFEAHAVDTLSQMRSALGALIAAIPGGVSRPVELGRALRIDAKLSWCVFEIVSAVDLLGAAQYVPGPGALRKLLRAAVRRGVAPESIERVSRAAEDFDRLVKLHSGDRSTFDLMIRGRASNEPDWIHMTDRRDAFRANSHIWGVQARTFLSAYCLQPGTEQGMTDGASIRGLVDFRRIRPNVPWVIARARCVDADGVMRRWPVRSPLEPGAPELVDSVPFLRQFCSEPLPQCRRIERTDGFVEHELVEGPVGRTAAITCIMGDIVRNGSPYYRDEHSSFDGISASVRTPCEVLIHDLLMHEGMFGRIAPELIVYSDLRGGPEYPAGGREPPRLPINASVDYLGKGPAVVATPDVPRYVELVRYVFDRLGWDGDRFDVYRVRVAYPVVSSIVVMQYPLRERSPVQ